jgi:hypothetical protein
MKKTFFFMTGGNKKTTIFWVCYWRQIYDALPIDRLILFLFFQMGNIKFRNWIIITPFLPLLQERRKKIEISHIFSKEIDPSQERTLNEKRSSPKPEKVLPADTRTHTFLIPYKKGFVSKLFWTTKIKGLVLKLFTKFKKGSGERVLC